MLVKEEKGTLWSSCNVTESSITLVLLQIRALHWRAKRTDHCLKYNLKYNIKGKSSSSQGVSIVI